MNKNLLLAGVSAVALAFSASVALASDTSGNTSDHNGTTNVNNGVGASINSSSNENNSGQVGNGNWNVKGSVTLSQSTHNDATKASNTASFGENSNVASSDLSATVASSNVEFRPHGGEYDGNLVDPASFQSVNGVSAVNQNVGINSNNQQSVTVATGDVGINALR